MERKYIHTEILNRTEGQNYPEPSLANVVNHTDELYLDLKVN